MPVNPVKSNKTYIAEKRWLSVWCYLNVCQQPEGILTVSGAFTYKQKGKLNQ